MQDRQKVKCPHCGGEGKVRVPSINDGELGYVKKNCRHCGGTGKMVLVVDAKIFNRKKPKIFRN